MSKEKRTKSAGFVCFQGVEVTEHYMEMPIVGWHEPRAGVTVDGENWVLEIGGGCRSIWVHRENDRRSFSISIEQLLPALIEYVRSK